ncbi:MAG: GNAT family N-acetyltransferase [Methylorubrum populi]
MEPLGTGHDRQTFASGVEALDRYIRDLASQDMRRMVSKCHVACLAGSMEIAGYYTLAAAEIPVNALPETTARKLPRYPTVPVVRMGRLAVDRRHRGVGLGAALIVNAVSQVLRAEIAAFALVVDAKDEGAAVFYEGRGFSRIADRVLVLPLATARKALPSG